MNNFSNLLIAICVGLSIFGTTSGAQAAPKQAKQAAAAKAPISTSSEAQDLFRALRSIEAKVSSGINYADYGREVSELTIAATAMDELLETRQQEDLRAELAAVVNSYQSAKDLWGSCVKSIQECRNGFIYIADTAPSIPVFLAKRILSENPDWNRSHEQGGALVAISGEQLSHVHKDTLLSKLWSKAGEQGKSLRGAMR